MNDLDIMKIAVRSAGKQYALEHKDTFTNPFHLYEKEGMREIAEYLTRELNLMGIRLAKSYISLTEDTNYLDEETKEYLL